jgi:tetratricopeptide (TPR) repeat protein
METDTFSNASIVEFSNKTFVNIHLRTDTDKKLAEQYKVHPIPVTFLLSPGGERLSTMVGYLPPEEYKQTLETALATHKKILALEPKLKASPDDAALLTEASGLYEELGLARKAAETLLRTAPKAADPKAHGEVLVKVFALLNDAEGDEEVNAAILDIAKRMDALDSDGKLGLKDKAAYARAMVDFNLEHWDDVIKKLEEVVVKWPDGDRAPVALLTIANVYHEGKHDNAKAEKTLKTLVEKYPKSEILEQAKHLLEHIKEHAEKK